MREELKPCPFCGNKKPESYLAHPQYKGEKNESDWCYWCVGCPECGAWFEIGYTPPKTLDDAHIEAVRAWNRRWHDTDDLIVSPLLKKGWK